jgi:DNA-binding beta-propeller fold protein YncE
MGRSKRIRNASIGATFLALVISLGIGQTLLEKQAAAQAKATAQAPMFEVDPLWPKPMPNNWVMGMTIGVGVDDRDHVWIIHRGTPPEAPAPAPTTLDRTEYAVPTPGGPRVSECCDPAPPVLEFDAAGNLVGHWGGPGQGYDWPGSNHGIIVDHKGYVWIGGNGPGDSHVLKFTREGKFVAQFGKPNARRAPTTSSQPETPVGTQGRGRGAAAGGQPQIQFVRNSHDMENFGRVAKIAFDPKANEAYLSDGYFNKRVAVIDMDSGKIKRYWGAYGSKPDDSVDTTPRGPYDPNEPPAKQFRNPVHCAEPSNDGHVYVCDRPNNRIQVFTKDGKFVNEVFVEPQTRTDGSVWDIAFSKDPQQRFLYLADGCNEHVYIFDRKSMQRLTHFGQGGRQPGMFLGVHSIATDSKGNIFTTETYTGKRLQKFVFKGLGPVTKEKQGPPWPRTAAK